ncbi:MAG: hypothetical protein K8I00_13250, partial [Candidatus Omnitrophica bacterium]|nr:hypothetical protein [Candidatus Omnitrophota bacterium]
FCMTPGNCGSEAPYVEVVNRFKNHPAILMWSIGDDWNDADKVSARFGFDDVEDAKSLINQAAGRITDPITPLDLNHPVTSALHDDADNFATVVTPLVHDMGHIDIWGLNVYRGESFGTLIDDWTFTLEGTMTVNGTIPLYISEYGTDSFKTTSASDDNGRSVSVGGEDGQSPQSSWIQSLHTEIVQNQARVNNIAFVTGGFVFEFNDEIYKAGNPNFGLDNLAMDMPDYAGYDENGHITYMPSVPPHPDCVAVGPFPPPCTTNVEHFGLVTADRGTQKTAFIDLKNTFESNTPIGNDIDYMLGDTTVSYSEIIEEGHTAITVIPLGPMPPFGFQLATDYYEISTTAAYSGPIEVCINYGPGVP